MCAICGVAYPVRLNQRVDQTQVVAMRDAMVHRGPDDAGAWISETVGLGHRRLSIVDLGGGHQPMSNEDGTIWIAFNGEIYNQRELRTLLQQRGHLYRTQSDTETIVHLYEEFGTVGVEKLRGMFAYAIWDSLKRTLVLARDRLGIKPLYYAVKDDGTLYFASEIKALIVGRAITPELNYDGLADYASNRHTSGEETLFHGVKRLLQGHTLQWVDGQTRIEPYWNLSFAKSGDRLSEDDHVERFGELFRESVRIHLMSDVPLGLFLSGGIDSSAIAAVMSGILDEPIKTFSVAFAERDANELTYARAVARAFRTDHHEIIVKPEQFFDILPTLVYQEDEPIAHPASVPLYFLSKLAAQHVKVVLTGEGSDELLAGYNKYRVTIHNLRFASCYERAVPAFLRQLVRQQIERLRGTSRLKRKMQRSFVCRPANLRDIYFDNFSVFPLAMQQRLFSVRTRERMVDSDPYRTSLRHIRESDAESVLDQLLVADLKTYLQELLMKQDQMSMAASLETRVPFLDHKFVEFAAHLPIEMKLRQWTTKYVLRRAMIDVLPKEIIIRKKMGFPVPLGSWLRGPFRHVLDEYLLSERAVDRGIFDHEYVRELVARHESGENHAERLWMIVNFEIWQRCFFDGESSDACGAGAQRMAVSA